MEANNIKIIRVLMLGYFVNRIIKNTPAVTKVDEWTKAEIGVGAAIAAGSQAEKGNWALFVQEARIKRIKIKLLFIWVINNSQEENMNIIEIEIIIKASPIRLDKIVIVPDEPDFGFWYKITSIYEEIPRPSQPKSIKTRLFLLINKTIDITNIIIINMNCLCSF